MTDGKPPNFWRLFARALGTSAGERSFTAFIPWKLAILTATPIAATYFARSCVVVPDISVSVTITSAIAVVGGFLGSISLSTSSYVQKMVSDYPFSDYLREEELFDQFLFWPQFTILIQIANILISMSAAVFIAVTGIQMNNYILAACMGFMLYAIWRTWALVDLVRVITWHDERYFSVRLGTS
jgi:hypothetical protein